MAAVRCQPRFEAGRGRLVKFKPKWEAGDRFKLEIIRERLRDGAVGEFSTPVDLRVLSTSARGDVLEAVIDYPLMLMANDLVDGPLAGNVGGLRIRYRVNRRGLYIGVVNLGELRRRVGGLADAAIELAGLTGEQADATRRTVTSDAFLNSALPADLAFFHLLYGARLRLGVEERKPIALANPLGGRAVPSELTQTMMLDDASGCARVDATTQIDAAALKEQLVLLAADLGDDADVEQEMADLELEMADTAVALYNPSTGLPAGLRNVRETNADDGHGSRETLTDITTIIVR